MDLQARLDAALAGRYVIDGEIGHGGMGVVFRARDLRHSRAVALKVLRPELAAAAGPERFEREIQIEAQLQHPNIVPLFDSGTADGLPFFAMPLVEGETLRDRLRRDGPLPLEDALRIADQVADALSYAHAHGVVHRDIKPENILLSNGHAQVADFGVARVAFQEGESFFTATGTALGTPAYMSPEQATGSQKLDGRSDLYSLGCVLFEMLGGEPPFPGHSAQVIISKHVLEPPPSIEILRPSVSPVVCAALHRTLAKVPADRFATAHEFRAALRGEGPVAVTPLGPAVSSRSRRRRLLLVAGGGVALAGAGALGVTQGWGGGPGVARDSSRYIVAPFAFDEPVPGLNEVERLQDALRRWDGISIALDEADPAAGRELRGSVSRFDGGLRVHAALYDVGSSRPLADHAVRLPVDLRSADSVMSSLVDHLVSRGRPVDPWGDPWGTRSLPALQAFEAGMGALEQWDLTAADANFAAAASFDPGFARAQLWTALARLWSGAEGARWSVAAEQAVLGAHTLGVRDRALATAVVAQARGDLGAACPLWERAVDAWPEEFAPWYGLARCLVADGRVVPDRGSPSGWSFRTSYQQALEGYRRAFERRPAILASLRERSYEELRSAFMVGNDMRGGRGGVGDTVFFAAEPAWTGDTLALVPYPLASRGSRRPPATTGEARRHQRERFRNVMLAWVTAQPRSAAAMEALAIGLAMLGDPAARDTLAHARRLATEPVERFRVAAVEVWMRLGFALPWDQVGIRHARALADSLLSGRIGGAEPDARWLPGLAALLGRTADAAAYARPAVVANAMGAPPALRATGPALLVYAASGGPPDSIRELTERVDRIIEEVLPPSDRPQTRLAWIARAATLAFPAVDVPEAALLEGQGDYVLDMQLAWRRGDVAAVRKGLAAVGAMRAGLSPKDVSLDALYSEAALLFEMGEAATAAAWLDPALRSLAELPPHHLGSPVLAAVLVRAVGLRARIAERRGDPDDVGRWRAAARALGSDADALPR